MKHLLSGTALAAALALAAPVWAQTNAPMTPSSRAAPSASAAAPMAPMASHRARPHRAGMAHRKTARHGKARGGSASDSVANQLNAQEAAKAGATMPPREAFPNPYGQRSPTQGIRGAGQVPQSPDYPSGPGPAYVPGQRQSSPSPNAPSGPGPAYVPGQYQVSPSPNAPTR
jgi:hypothetical protein